MLLTPKKTNNTQKSPIPEEQEISADWKMMGVNTQFLASLPLTLKKNLITSLAKKGCSFEDADGNNVMDEFLEIPEKIARRIQSISEIPDLFGQKIHARLEDVKAKLRKEAGNPLKMLKTVLIPVNAKALEMIERTCAFSEYLGDMSYAEGSLLKDIEDFLAMTSRNVPLQVINGLGQEKRVGSEKWNAMLEIRKAIKATPFGKKINTNVISDKLAKKNMEGMGRDDFYSQIELQDRLEIEFLETAIGNHSVDHVAKKALLYIMGQMSLMYRGLDFYLPHSFKEADINEKLGRNLTERSKNILEIYIRCLATIEHLKRMERYLP